MIARIVSDASCFGIAFDKEISGVFRAPADDLFSGLNLRFHAVVLTSGELLQTRACC
jgi:hypothetical protein